jgi:hypothetical protein
MMKKLALGFSLLLLHAGTYAQDKSLSGEMRGNDKIYVVAAVALFILIAIFLYLIRLDRKVSRLEQNRHS